MILLLDTSTPICKLGFADGDWRYNHEWLADRQLAKGLLGYMQEQLAVCGKDFSDITGIAAYQGPGSFTGLRIGLTVLNTMADAMTIPIVGVSGEDWGSTAMARLAHGENDQLVVPVYGAEATITTPRK